MASHTHHSTSSGEVLVTLCAFEWHLTCVLLPHISHLKRTFPSGVFSSNLPALTTHCTLEGLLFLLVCSLLYFQETLCVDCLPCESSDEFWDWKNPVTFGALKCFLSSLVPFRFQAAWFWKALATHCELEELLTYVNSLLSFQETLSRSS